MGLIGGVFIIRSYLMGYVVVLDGFSYDDLVKISKDFDIPMTALLDIYLGSKTAKEFESKWKLLG